MLESVYMLKLFSVFCLVPHTPPPSSPPPPPNYANALQKLYSALCRSCTVQDQQWALPSRALLLAQPFQPHANRVIRKQNNSVFQLI